MKTKLCRQLPSVSAYVDTAISLHGIQAKQDGQDKHLIQKVPTAYQEQNDILFIWRPGFLLVHSLTSPKWDWWPALSVHRSWHHLFWHRQVGGLEIIYMLWKRKSRGHFGSHLAISSAVVLALRLCGFSNKLLFNSFCCINSTDLFLWAFCGARLLMSPVGALTCFLPLLWGAADLGSVFWPGFPAPACDSQQRIKRENFSFPHPTYTRVKYCSQ